MFGCCVRRDGHSQSDDGRGDKYKNVGPILGWNGRPVRKSQDYMSRDWLLRVRGQDRSYKQTTNRVEGVLIVGRRCTWKRMHASSLEPRRPKINKDINNGIRFCVHIRGGVAAHSFRVGGKWKLHRRIWYEATWRMDWARLIQSW